MPLMLHDSLVFCIAVPLVSGLLCAQEASEVVKSKWYASIKKAIFNIPVYAIAPIWTYLHISAGYALYLVNKRIQSPNHGSFGQFGIYAFWVQLFTNFLCFKLYLVWRDIDLALSSVLFISATSVVTTLCFFSASNLAGVLMIPYVLWAFYATALIYSINEMNPNFADEPPFDQVD